MGIDPGAKSDWRNPVIAGTGMVIEPINCHYSPKYIKLQLTQGCNHTQIRDLLGGEIHVIGCVFDSGLSSVSDGQIFKIRQSD